MDDDWDQDATADDGGGWGDDAAADGGDGWGELENQDGDEPQQEAEAVTVEVQIENAFYEAEDMMRNKPKEALEHFQRVVELAASVKPLSGDTLAFVFNSLRHSVTLRFETKDLPGMMTAYRQLLPYLPQVTRNEAREAIEAVLNCVSDSDDYKFADEVFTLTSNAVAGMTDQERLWFRVNMKHAELYFNRQDFKNAEEALDRLLKFCNTSKTTSDAELLEIYALEVRISAATGNALKLKGLYEKTKNLTAAVKDPKSQSVIKECWGQMFGDEGEWARAYGEFFSAFTHYQETGNREKAKQCLKYLVMANMLSNGIQNPFDANEAKVFQTDKDIAAVDKLKQAYDRCDVHEFLPALRQLTSDGDKFVAKHIQSMVRDFRTRSLQRTLASYSRVKLDYLAQTLQIDADEVEELIVPLILEGKVIGKIDQVKGLLDLTENTGSNAKYVAVERWVTTLNNLRARLPIPAPTSQRY